MNKIKAFFAKYSITTHSVAAFLGAAFVAYKEVPQVHDLALSIYSAIPSKVQSVVVAGIALYSWYRNGQSASPAAPPVEGK